MKPLSYYRLKSFIDCGEVKTKSRKEMDTKNDDGLMSASVSKRFQSKLDKFKHCSDWNGMITMLKRYALKYPNEYYIFQQLAQTYYINCIGQFQLACQYAEKAFNMEPDDDLNIYTYACSLYYVGRLDESFDLFSRITSKDVNAIAYGEHGEGILYAKALINDSIYMMGVICQDRHQYKEAKELFIKHLVNRRRGQYSDFTKEQVLNHILRITKKRTI